MSTPKSRKPSPLIAVNSPKVALWYQCRKCLVYLNQKDTGLHSCEAVMQMKSSFVKENSLYSLAQLSEGVDNQNLNIDQLVLLSLPAIQLCKFQIGEPVHLTDFKHKRHVCKTVWPTTSKSLLSVQVSKNVLHRDLKLNPGDPLRVSHLSSLPQPLSSVCLHCASNIAQYEPDSLATAVASQMRSSLVHVGQTVTVGFYGMDLCFTIQKVLPCPETNKQTPQKTVDSGGNTTVDSIDDNLRSLSLSDNTFSHELLFYKIVSSTKFVITNYKSRNNDSKASDGVKYRLEDLGGLDQIVENIVNILNLSLEVSPSIEGMRKCNGLLIHGVNGTGKTSLIHALATHMNVYTLEIPVAELFSKYYGEAESRLKASFDLALVNVPALLLLDNLDVLCSAKNRSDQERRVLSCLVSQMDRLHEIQACVVLLAVVSSLDSVEVLLRSPGRLDQEIELPVPSRSDRHAILKCLLARVPHSLSETEVESIAFVTHGFVGADLAALVSSAATSALLAAKERTDVVLNSGSIKLAVKDGTMEVNSAASDSLPAKKRTTELSYDHVTLALDTVKPSAMRQVLVEVPNVRWADIGGQAEVKLKLRQCVEWPLKHPEAFARLGIKPPRGILMFGPPGCSKTMIAKALATESKLNFISVKGPELFRKYVGESERCVRDVFKRARQVSPSVIFFDELDALAGERGEGGGGGGSNVQERVLAQMLTEMDGVVPLNNVTIVAATNRPDRIDKALLRPGRLDRLIYVPLPDDETRAAILELRLSRSPVAADVQVARLVEATRGYSGAELVAVCDEAALFALETDLEAESVSERDFLAALEVVKPRTPPQLVQLYENYVKK